MGSQCKNIHNSHPFPQNSHLQPQSHPSFGEIHLLHLPNQLAPKAFKKISAVDSHLVDNFNRRVEFARECDNSISTLVEVYEFQMVDEEGEEASSVRKEIEDYEGISCKDKNPFILVDFKYYPPCQCISAILKEKSIQLTKMKDRVGTRIFNEAQKVRLSDYAAIDKLSSQLRQVVNVYYQQIEILRMIDHVVGALYFLHHFDVSHGAVRPEMLLQDEQGRFVLVDRQLFQRASNYTIALDMVSQEQPEIMQYISPQYVPLLRNKSLSSPQETEKIDIFCVGIIALQMCLLRPVQLYEYANFVHGPKFKELQLKKALTAVGRCYSDGLVKLLSDMLAPNLTHRVDYIDLIDSLNPLLMQNLDAIKKIHQSRSVSRIGSVSHMDKTFSSESGSQDLRQKLFNMEESFQKVMNNRVVLCSRSPNQQQLKQQEEELLAKLSKVRSTRARVETLSSNSQNHNPQGPSAQQVTPFQLQPNPTNPKRYISGKQLQAIVFKEYQQIKTRRQQHP